MGVYHELGLRPIASGAYDRELPDVRRRLEQVATALDGLPARPHLHVPADGQIAPVLEFTLDEAALGRTALEVCRRMRRGDPPIQVGHALLHEGKLTVHPLCLKEEQTAVLARRLREELTP
jgi:L-seryl-tRNA(Ser) seleniumtransferase